MNFSTNLTLIVLTITILLASGAQTLADPPESITYQGRLNSEAGEPVSDGAKIFTFRIYDRESEGDQLWREDHVLQVRDGIFNALLGSDVALDLPFDQEYWIGISLDGGDELEPRMPMSSVPYAMHAMSVSDGAISGVKMDTSAIQGGHNVTVERDPDYNFIISAESPEGSPWTQASDGISYLDGNVGIATSSPEADLHVGGDIHADGQIVIDANDTENFSYLRFRSSVASPRIYHAQSDDHIVFSGMEDVRVIGDFAVTGSKSFIQEHPNDPSLQIRYVALEAGEAGVYWRGSATTQNGRAEVELPEHFGFVTSEESLTVNITPRGKWAPLYVEEITVSKLTVVLDDRFADDDVAFDFMINGIRLGYEDLEVIEPVSHIGE